MRITIKAVNAEIVRKGLADFEGDLKRIPRQTIRAAIERVKRKMEEYPPERPGQKYKRTGRFFYSWGIDRVGDMGYSLGNYARNRRGQEYGKYVVGGADGTGQAWMHEGRWPVFRDVFEKEIDDLPNDIGKHLNFAIKRRRLDGSE